MGSHLALQTSWKRCDIIQHFILFCASYVWRFEGKGILHPGNSSYSPLKKWSRYNTHKGTVKTLPSFLFVMLLKLKSFVERTLEIFLQIINSYKRSSITYICRNIFLSLPEPHWNVVLCWLSSVELPSFDLFGRSKAQECDGPNRGEGGSIWFL